MKKTDTLLLATLNNGKIEEYLHLFKSYPKFKVKTVGQLIFNPGKLELAESGNTYEENAMAKCHWAHYAAKLPTISDDTGLEVEALDGKPGVHSHRFATPVAGLSQDRANVEKLLLQLKGLPREKRAARFVCTIVFMMEGIHFSVTENIPGTILEAPAGIKGFGYDSVFLPAGHTKTFAQMDMEEKNKCSHRALALKKLFSEIEKRKLTLVHP
jgi:XTP/dITP diphosphohydrolase